MWVSCLGAFRVRCHPLVSRHPTWGVLIHVWNQIVYLLASDRSVAYPKPYTLNPKPEGPTLQNPYEPLCEPSLLFIVDLGVSQNGGTLFGGPYNKDYSILGSKLGPPILGNYHFPFSQLFQLTKPLHPAGMIQPERLRFKPFSAGYT